MNHWRTFNLLCGTLRAGLLGGASPYRRANLPWERLIEGSSHHYVTPALAWCLRDRIGIPAEIRDYFEAALALNGERNQRLIEALTRVAAALNAIDIEPVLLKGAGRLVDGTYPMPALRVLGDLDILVPVNRSADAFAALQRSGFHNNADATPLPPAHHHLPMLCERDTGAGVELHTELTRAPHDVIIPSAWFWERSTPFQLQGLRVRLPDATASVAHTVVHDQMLHIRYELRRFELRQLVDLAVVRAKHESAIDWGEIDRRFSGAGVGQVLATYLEFARVFFGQRPPRLSHAPRRRAVADLRRILQPPVTPHLATAARMPVDYLMARLRDPRGLLKLFSSETWTKRFRLIRSTLDTGKWR